MNEERLFPQELADKLRRGRCYIFAMKKAGFKMPGGTATLTGALEWLSENPDFKTTDYYNKEKPKAKPARGGRIKQIYLEDAPGGDLEKEIYFFHGENALKESNQPAMGVCEQVYADHKNGVEGFSGAEVGELLREKIVNLDHGFFTDLAAMLKRRKEKAGAIAPLHLEMVLIKMKCDQTGEQLTWQDVSDRLTHSQGIKDTIEKVAGSIGLKLIKRPRGRPSNK